MKNFLLAVDEKNANHTLSSFLSRMLADGVVGSVMVPQNTDYGKNVVMTLVKRPAVLKKINPFAPVSPVNGARIVSDLTFSAAPDEKIGVLLRSCETRALVELVKHNQARLENIVIIGMDCLGAFDPVDYREMCESGGDPAGEWMAASGGGEFREDIRGKSIRRGCSACGYIEAEHAAIHLGWVGLGGKQILVSAGGEYIEWASSFLGEGSEMVPGDRLKSMEAIRSRRDDNKKRLYEEFSARTKSIESLLAELDGCIKCHNCRQACPLCFCRECVFSTEIFRRDPEFYLSRAHRKGLMGMPADKLLFHLTRLNHMGLGCVGCSQCESACPAKIPVAMIFKTAGERMQQVFDYAPGRSLEEEPPLAGYKESELEPR